MIARGDRDKGLTLPEESTEIQRAWRERAPILVKFDGK